MQRQRQQWQKQRQQQLSAAQLCTALLINVSFITFFLFLLLFKSYFLCLPCPHEFWLSAETKLLRERSRLRCRCHSRSRRCRRCYRNRFLFFGIARATGSARCLIKWCVCACVCVLLRSQQVTDTHTHTRTHAGGLTDS